MAAASAPGIGRWRLLAYALPALPLAALALPLYLLVPTFYTETLGLSLGAVGGVLLAVRLIDAAGDVALGLLSDRIKTRLGRRRTLFLAALPVAAVSAYMLFAPPAGAGLAYLAFWATGVSLGYTAATLAYGAWGAELSGDYRERAAITAAREGATLIGTLVAISLPFLTGFDRSDGRHGDSLHGLALIGLTVLLTAPTFGLTALRFVPEPVDHSRTRLDLREGLKHLAANRPFLRLLAAFVLNGLANAIPATLFLYFVADRLGAPELRGPLLFAYFLSAIAGVPLALKVAARVGKHRAWCGSMLIACAIFAAAGFLGPGDSAAFAAICVATGLLLAFDLVIPPAIQADVIDADTAASGEQRSGLYFAAWTLATKISLALSVGLVFPLLDVAGFTPGAPGGAGTGALAALYAWLPLAPKLAAIALMWRFPLDEAAQRALRARIESAAAP
ncbi:MFS transporter [Ancylobacter sp. WKF20]|uniref:MFS transporter n=1 Tax=Ancylobacter sp. WKF20 TaxID=3039801 RepID=UPI0024344CE4|nr:MFS transporter [Ancylobacter sp. WKF20]WGD31072.1 MFS transporter [Ancylobacter sp. WKF20]